MGAIRVAATCNRCDDQHLLGDRPRHSGESDLAKRTDCTTECPACGETPYGTSLIELSDVKPDEERIRDVIDVKGVGAQTRDNLLAAYPSWTSFQSATLADLTEVGGVGKANGQRIIDNRPEIKS